MLSRGIFSQEYGEKAVLVKTATDQLVEKKAKQPPNSKGGGKKERKTFSGLLKNLTNSKIIVFRVESPHKLPNSLADALVVEFQ